MSQFGNNIVNNSKTGKLRDEILRFKDYALGDTVYSVNLKSGLYLECVKAGKTASLEQVLNTKKVNDTINDGTVTWKVRTLSGDLSVDSISMGDGKVTMVYDKSSKSLHFKFTK